MIPFTFVAFCLGFPWLQNEGGTTVPRIYSIAPLRGPLRNSAGTHAEWGGFIQLKDAPAPRLDGWFDPVESGSAMSSADLQALLGAASGDGPPVELDALGDLLTVRATPAQHTRIRDALKTILAGASHSVNYECEAWLLPPGSPPPPRTGLLTSSEAKSASAEISKNGRLLYSGVVGTAPGRLARAGSRTRVPFTPTYHPEIAKKAKIAQPATGAVQTGFEVFISGYPSADGRNTFTTISAYCCELAAMEPFETRGRDIGLIDIPKALGVSLASSGTIATGLSCIIEGSARDLGTLILMVTPGAGTARPGPVEFAAQSGGAAAGTTTTWIPAGSLHSRAGRSFPFIDDSFLDISIPAAPAPNLANLLKTSDDCKIFGGQGGSLRVSGPAASVRRVIENLSALESRDQATRCVQIKMLASMDPATAITRNHQNIPLASATFMLASGRSAGAILGREETGVEGYQVSIAEEATVAAPMVRRLLSGCLIHIRNITDDAGGAGARIEIDLKYYDFGPRERHVSTATDVGDRERIPTRHAEINRAMELAGSSPVVVGELGAFTGTKPGLRIYVTASETAPEGK